MEVRSRGLRNSRTVAFRVDALISKADEVKRIRALGRSEEAKLLAVCTGQRTHIRPLIIAAVDTGMRQGEPLALTWEDINLIKRTITVRAMATKTLTSRIVPVSTRLHNELMKLPYPLRVKLSLVYS